MADDFSTQQVLHPSKRKACFHAILSFYPGEEEKLGDEKMLEIAKKYLEEIGITGTQYAIARHTEFNLIKDVSGKMEYYTQILENPKEKNVHHIHHFHWPLWWQLVHFYFYYWCYQFADYMLAIKS